MLRTGMQARCDRCGLQEFYPDVKTLVDITEGHKWRMVGNKGLLCPNCTKLFDKTVETFFNEIGDK